jgi:hypothetical protein
MTRRQILQYDRADFDVVSELEQKTGFTVRPDSLLIQMISAPHSDETERPISWRYFRRRLRPVAEPHRSRAQGCDTSPPATSCKFDRYWRVRGDRQSAGCYSAMCSLSFDDESGRQATGQRKWEFMKGYEGAFRNGDTYMCGPNSGRAWEKLLGCNGKLCDRYGSGRRHNRGQ